MPASDSPLAARGKISTFAALSDPAFRILWIGGTFWYVARMMEMAVLAWLVLELTDSPAQVAFVGFFRMLPMFLLGLLAGSIADRFSKRRVLASAQVVCLVANGALLTLLIAGVVQPWHGFFSIFMSGISNALDFSSRRSYYSEILPPERLVNAMSLDMASMTGSGMIGPVLGGLLIAFTGFTGAYVVMVCLYVICLGSIIMVKRPAPAHPAGRMGSPLAQVAASVQTIRTNRMLWVALLVTVALNFFGSPFMSLISVVARDTLHVEAVLYGILSAANSFGALMGSLILASRGSTKYGTVYTLGAAAFLFGIFCFAISPIYVVSLVVLVMGGFGMSGFGTMQTTIALQAVGPAQRGRALGAIALGIGASPLGTLLVGVLADRVGTPYALAFMAGAGVLTILALFFLFPELRDKKAKEPIPGLAQSGAA